MLNNTNAFKSGFSRRDFGSNSITQLKSNSVESESLKETINETSLCVLRINQENRIEIDYLEILNPLDQPLSALVAMCNNNDVSIEQIIHFIENTDDFNLLTRRYAYCENLASSYQGFYADNHLYIAEIKELYQLIICEYNENSKNFNCTRAIRQLKLEVGKNYELWCKAYAIELAYNKCRDEKQIITFSHRVKGWSDPVYQLTPNLTLELKTNFGYGSVSYFYTKLKYKNIEITPFSDWINYRIAQTNEIIRYSKSHRLINSSWQEAMSFSKEACNLSLSNEEIFVEKYIVDECETMVSGLEKILRTSEFTFKNGDHFENDTFTGHRLIVFRAEKIAGALDFISKILEFDGITKMNAFVTRIKKCNVKLQPFLCEEIKILNQKLEKLTEEKNNLQPEYDGLLVSYNDYNSKCSQLRFEMLKSGELDENSLDENKLLEVFSKIFPDYKSFSEKFVQVKNQYTSLSQKIVEYTSFKESIEFNERKISKYFEK